MSGAHTAGSALVAKILVDDLCPYLTLPPPITCSCPLTPRLAYNFHPYAPSILTTLLLTLYSTLLVSYSSTHHIHTIPAYYASFITILISALTSTLINYLYNILQLDSL
ncbi:hypothetical protein DFH27DRAFT_20247 [Peziza echinospora]|nr:hypothetical protein DFH27DRAFT_20247 [Peziza echinospora]